MSGVSNNGYGYKTPFLNYVDRRQADLEAQGYKFANPADKKDLIEFVAQGWKKLSIKDKEAFRTVNPSSRASSSASISPFLEVQPPSFIQMEREAEVEYENATFSIFKLLNPIKPDIPISKLVFVIINANAYGQFSRTVFMPAEFAMVAFSLEDGIVDNYSALIDPGKLPNSGYCSALDVKIESKRLGLPTPPYSKVCRDYESIWLKMTRFIRSYRTTDTTTYLFCLRSQMGKVKGCLDVLRAKSGVSCEYELLPLGMLFQQFDWVGREVHKAEEKRQEARQLIERKMAEDDGITDKDYPRREDFGVEGRIRAPIPLGSMQLFPAEKLADNYLETHQLSFYYQSKCACPHHMLNLAVADCPLQDANAYAFRMIDHLIDYFDIVPMEGAHYPLSNDIAESDRRRRMVAIWGDKGQKDLPGFYDSCYWTEPLKEGSEATKTQNPFLMTQG